MRLGWEVGMYYKKCVCVYVCTGGACGAGLLGRPAAVRGME